MTLMSENNPKRPHLSEAPDAAACEQYRSVSGLAVVGLFLGLISPLALVDPVAWLVPVAAVAVCAAAWFRIRRHATSMIGSKAAACGLVVALLCGSAAVSQWFALRWFVERQARGIAAAWFELLRDDQPLKAHQLNLIPTERKPLDEDLPGVYKLGPKNRDDLYKFLENPLVRTVLALGEKADIRFYQCEDSWGPFGKENVKELFSITYTDENGQKKTFFASVLLRRFPPNNVEGVEEINWVVADMKGGVEPPWIY